MSLCNAFTVDVEDYYHVSAFEADVDRGRWDTYESRVERNTQRLLDLLDEHEVRATFFVLGWIAERSPRLVQEIDSRGHELGSHSYWHRLIYQQTPEEFREDLRRSIQVIEDAIGKPVTTYRAPSFSVTKDSLWALDILKEEGIQIDSSIFPIHHDRYGIPGAKTCLHQVDTPHGPIWEFPVTVHRVAGVNLPISGGGYFRLYPLRWTTHCLGKVNAQSDQPFVFYIHPWELDPGQPRLRAGSQLGRFRHYLGLSKTEHKLAGLLQKFRFDTLSATLAQSQAQAQSNAITGA